jgi:hypothetical protein
MTSTDRNDLMPSQEKLEWVTPKISLMGAESTEGGGQKTVILWKPAHRLTEIRQILVTVL